MNDEEKTKMGAGGSRTGKREPRGSYVSFPSARWSDIAEAGPLDTAGAPKQKIFRLSENREGIGRQRLAEGLSDNVHIFRY